MYIYMYIYIYVYIYIYIYIYIYTYKIFKIIKLPKQRANLCQISNYLIEIN